ncbi:Abi family protein [Thiohalomonas denitrificans]|uniref:Abortive infection bacteriophage resistance protein n=1 Tax=Thiohalomonas denitrificans TaxID=415747 RepID=A0A1G5QZH2_9GAMM|nr:Abi family protein [Thiohalomonas denitrificans]SCZ67116.1 Abortive infection bacteriophage resistance protein [Thiohalomonas denitrificans]
MRRFAKPPLTIEEQLQLLRNRGLTILHEERASRFLEVVSLFRLSPYMRPFQHGGNPDHHFHAGTTLRQIVTRYRFDSDLRSLVMEAVERVEVAARACISNHMAPAYGAHWYSERRHFKREFDHDRLVGELQTKLEQEAHHFRREAERIQQSRASDETKAERIEHRKRDNYFRFYGQTYAEPPLPPSWAALEELSLGALSRLYKGIARDYDRKQIANRFALPQHVFASWLHTLTFIRNCCAHHARLWNRELPLPPKRPKSQSWSLPHAEPGQPEPGRRIFVVLLMLAYMMNRIAPDHAWKERLVELLDRYPDAPLGSMGFIGNWKRHPVWAGEV